MALPDITWEGASGATYGYWIHRIGTNFKGAGNYIYAQETQPGQWRPVYIGQTSSLQDQAVDHEREACVARNGATHIHAHTASEGEDRRRAEQDDLVKKWNPGCND